MNATHYSIALIGNPNCGKTTLFNALTGARHHVGNWPGVTIEKKTGHYAYGDKVIDVVDLPGTYALDAHPASLDERVAHDFIAQGGADLIVNIVDASNLERNLYLTTQLAAMQVPMLVVLNMTDVAQSKGQPVDAQALAACLGCPVLPIVAAKNIGLDALKDAVDKACEHKTLPGLLPSDDAQGDDVAAASERYALAGALAQASIHATGQGVHQLTERLDALVLHRWLGIPIYLLLMYLMFMLTIQIGGSFIDFFDQAAGALFVDGLAHGMSSVGAPEWLTVVLAKGIGGGIQTVATFIPVIGFLYLFLSVLEDSGYMARAAFVMDRLMNAIGLPGKSFVPMIVGFGCNVPAIMATRTLEKHRDRLMTIAMAPFMSCGARLPVYVLFAAAFFPNDAQNVVFALYLIGIVAAVATSFILKNSLLKGKPTPYVMELPPYHVPTLKGILIHSGDRLKSFIVGAGRIIVPMVLVLNLLNAIGTDGSFGNENTDKSVLAEVGRTITPAFHPFGLTEENWPAAVGIFTGVLAKEAVVGTLDATYSALAKSDAAANGELPKEEEPFSLSKALSAALATIPEKLGKAVGQWADPLGIAVGDLNDSEAAADQKVDTSTFGAMAARFDGAAGAFAYLLFILLYFPCTAAIAAVVQESGARWAMFVATWTSALAYGSATLCYQWAHFARDPIGAALWAGGIFTVFAAAFLVMRRYAQRTRSADTAVLLSPATALCRSSSCASACGKRCG
jgi:ferrous iron transport protein B